MFSKHNFYLFIIFGKHNFNTKEEEKNQKLFLTNMTLIKKKSYLINITCIKNLKSIFSNHDLNKKTYKKSCIC